jgi:cob(I)alamin adenosyltransferase
MGNRLTKIYTRTGDDGTTGLADGSRISKDSLRVAAMGEVDHLNAFIGAVLSHESVPANVRECLTDVQHDLFDLGAELCIPGLVRIAAGHIKRLETQLDAMNRDLSRLEEFILPGGAPTAAMAHLARTACRKAECAVLALHRESSKKQGAGMPARYKYLNRLSDLLFVVARALNRSAARADVIWIQRKTEVGANERSQG